MRTRIVYSFTDMCYYLGDGRKIPDSRLHPNEQKLQDLIQDGERKTDRTWMVDKERLEAIYNEIHTSAK